VKRHLRSRPIRAHQQHFAVGRGGGTPDEVPTAQVTGSAIFFLYRDDRSTAGLDPMERESTQLHQSSAFIDVQRNGREGAGSQARWRAEDQEGDRRRYKEGLAVQDSKIFQGRGQNEVMGRTSFRLLGLRSDPGP